MPYIKLEAITKLFSEAFFDAVQRYDRESIRAFFTHVTNVEAAQLRNEQGNTALHIAVKAGRGDLVKELLERGFNPDQENYNGVTPRQMGEGASDRIKEHLGLLHATVESESEEVNEPVDESKELRACEVKVGPVVSLTSAGKETPTLPLPPLPPVSSVPTTSLPSTVPPLSLPTPPLPPPSTSGIPVSSSIPLPSAPGPIPLPSRHDIAASEPMPRPLSVPVGSVSLPATITASAPRPQSVEMTDRVPINESASNPIQPCDLKKCTNIRDFLSAVGLQEYIESFDSAHVVDTKDMFKFSEEDFKKLGVKFGHRKRLIEVLASIDPLYSFLQDGKLMDKYDRFKELGFDNIWSLMGIQESYQEKLGLTKEEMERAIASRNMLIESSKSTLEKLPELQRITDSTESKPILMLIFSSERADSIISVRSFLV